MWWAPYPKAWGLPAEEAAQSRSRSAPETISAVAGCCESKMPPASSHLLTGSGPVAGPGEPRPGFDPVATTRTQRRQAKAAELAALDRDQARLLGMDRVGYRTLLRWEVRRRRFGPVGCADDRWLRPRAGHPCVGEQVREAIHAVHQETLHRSRVSMRTRRRARAFA